MYIKNTLLLKNNVYMSAAKIGDGCPKLQSFSKFMGEFSSVPLRDSR